MVNLDDKEAILKIQGGDKVIRSVDAYPKQLQVAWSEAQKLEIPAEFKTATSVVVSGMGGSRFPALIIKELFKNQLRVPIEIQDDYHPPSWAGEHTVAILSSYSGTTEEVLYSAKALANQGVNKFAGITVGGDLVNFLKERNAPIYTFDPVYNPSGQPRIAIGYMVGGTLGILHALGAIKVDVNAVTAAITSLNSLLKGYQVDVPQQDNKAKQLAQKIYGRYPYYIVSEFLRGTGNAVANQTNETAKAISDFRIIPELNHHLMEGLKFPQELKKLALFIFFYSNLYSDRIQKRFKITKDVVEQNEIETLWVELQGKTEVEQALELLGFGGYLTMYLSSLYVQDPSVIPFVDYFKEQMKK